MGKNIRSSSSPKVLATSFPMPPLADAMDAVRLSVDRFCLLAGVEALAGHCQTKNLAIFQSPSGCWKSQVFCAVHRKPGITNST